jgi:two-component system, OmpR family, alkaline phosphatase synthesis response regulator PhoP
MTNILIADDESAVVETFEKFFVEAGYKTFTALNAKAAMKIITSKPIDLAILDLLMPEVSGVDLAKQIRKNPETKDLKIIFLTVVEKAGREIARVVSEVQPVDWLQKPVDAVVLREAVAKALRSNHG